MRKQMKPIKRKQSKSILKEKEKQTKTVVNRSSAYIFFGEKPSCQISRYKKGNSSNVGFSFYNHSQAFYSFLVFQTHALFPRKYIHIPYGLQLHDKPMTFGRSSNYQSGTIHQTSRFSPQIFDIYTLSCPQRKKKLGY